MPSLTAGSATGNPAPGEYAGLGTTQVWVGPGAADPVGWTERICELVLPRLAEIG